MSSPDYSATANQPASGNADSSNVAFSKLLSSVTGVNRSRKQVAADRHYPASNTAAVVSYSGVSGQYHVVRGVALSYDADPTGGNFKIEDVSGTTVLSIDIASKGYSVITFPKPIRAAAVNTALICTLAAGGSSVTGKLTMLAHTTEA